MKIEIWDYKKLNNPITIDVRSEEKYKLDHIPNAINIPMEEILLNPTSHLDKSKKYYIYCERGLVSNLVCRELFSLGYDVVEIIGGYSDWKLC